MNRRNFAIVTALSLFLMTLLAAHAIGFAYGEFYTPEQLDNLTQRIAQNPTLYNVMLIEITLILVLDLIVSYSLYMYFVKDHKLISFLASALRVTYTILFGIATYYLSGNLSPNLTESLALANFKHFEAVWDAGLVIFGMHLFLIGMLMKRHCIIPSALWYLMLFAGLSYIVVHLFKLSPSYSEYAALLVTALALPMALGELGLAIWLLIRGGKLNTVD